MIPSFPHQGIFPRAVGPLVLEAEEQMRVTDRYELAADLSAKYRNASKQERGGKLLDAFCLATGYHRKYAAAVISGRQRRKASPTPRRRWRRYGDSFTAALAVLWESSGYVCAERLQAWLVELLGLLEQHGDIHVDDDTRRLVGSVSVSTVERSLHELRRQEVGRRMCQTKPGTLLRRQIPVIVGHWKDLDEPG